MSHRDDCPDRWEARREGERAFERGSASWRNPYDDNGEDGCREAEEEWRYGYRSAERRDEERRQEEAEREAAEQRRRDEERAYEEARYDFEAACNSEPYPEPEEPTE